MGECKSHFKVKCHSQVIKVTLVTVKGNLHENFKHVKTASQQSSIGQRDDQMNDGVY